MTKADDLRRDATSIRGHADQKGREAQQLVHQADQKTREMTDLLKRAEQKEHEAHLADIQDAEQRKKQAEADKQHATGSNAFFA
jgi:hypothetical protein